MRIFMHVTGDRSLVDTLLGQLSPIEMESTVMRLGLPAKKPAGPFAGFDRIILCGKLQSMVS
jgi:hypothetical protein